MYYPSQRYETRKSNDKLLPITGNFTVRIFEARFFFVGNLPHGNFAEKILPIKYYPKPSRTCTFQLWCWTIMHTPSKLKNYYSQFRFKFTILHHLTTQIYTVHAFIFIDSIQNGTKQKKISHLIITFNA